MLKSHSTARVANAKMRGYICKAAFTWAEQELGRQHVLAVQQKAPEAVVALALDLTRTGAAVLASTWYPAPAMHQLTDALFGEFELDEQAELARRAGRYVFDQQITGLQRALLGLMMSPKRYIKHAPKAWLHNFSDGTLHFEHDLEAIRPWHRCVYLDWGAHHPVICQMMMQGKRVIYEAKGCKEVEIQVESCDPDRRGCASLASWNGAQSTRGQRCEGGADPRPPGSTHCH